MSFLRASSVEFTTSGTSWNELSSADNSCRSLKVKSVLCPDVDHLLPPEDGAEGLGEEEVGPQPGAQSRQSDPVRGVQLLAVLGGENLVDLQQCHQKLGVSEVLHTSSRTESV